MVLAHQLGVTLLMSMPLFVDVMTAHTLIFQLLMQPVSMLVAMGVVVVIALVVVPASQVKNVVVLAPQASPAKNVEALVVQSSRAKLEWSLHMSNFQWLTH